MGRGRGRRWTERTPLPERQVEPNHLKTSRAKRMIDRDKQRRIQITARAMRKYEPTSHITTYRAAAVKEW